jgi:hypothetical protein
LTLAAAVTRVEAAGAAPPKRKPLGANEREAVLASMAMQVQDLEKASRAEAEAKRQADTRELDPLLLPFEEYFFVEMGSARGRAGAGAAGRRVTTARQIRTSPRTTRSTASTVGGVCSIAPTRSSSRMPICRRPAPGNRGRSPRRPCRCSRFRRVSTNWKCRCATV